MGKLFFVEVRMMAKANKSTSGANIQKAGQQNAQFGAEFASETDAAQVKKANAKAEANKQQASGQSAAE